VNFWQSKVATNDQIKYSSIIVLQINQVLFVKTSITTAVDNKMFLLLAVTISNSIYSMAQRGRIYTCTICKEALQLEGKTREIYIATYLSNSRNS